MFVPSLELIQIDADSEFPAMASGQQSRQDSTDASEKLGKMVDVRPEINNPE